MAIQSKKAFFDLKKFLDYFSLRIEEINVCAVTLYIRNVTPKNFFFNLKKKLSLLKDNKIK